VQADKRKVTQYLKYSVPMMGTRDIVQGRNVFRSSGCSLSNALLLPRFLAAILLLASAGLALGAGDPPLPTIPGTNFNILSFGGFGDGVSNNATAINNAISAANTAGGGTVEIPANGTLSTYMSGPITLKSSVNLQIDTNAMLKMLPKSTYPNSSTPFILGSSLHDCEITGGGTIDGQYSTWGGNDPRPNFIEYDHTLKILIQGVTLQNPPKFHIMVHNNNGDLTIQNMTINTPNGTANTDGIDLASTNVLIRNCFISDGDDNIQIGSSSAFARNITISNCTFGTGHGLSIGQPTQDGVSNLLVNSCTWNGTEYGLHIKTDRAEGGLIQNLTYQNLVMSNVNFVIAFYMHYDTIGAPSSTISVTPSTVAADTINNVGTLTPKFQNITISNVTATSIGGNIAGIIWGLPESLVTNVTLIGVNISAPTKTFCVYDSTGIQFIDCNIDAPTTGTNTFTIYNAGITVSSSVANTNLMTLGGLAKPPTNNVLAFFNGRASSTDSNMFGAGSITLGGSTLTFSQSAVTFSNNLNAVSASTLLLSSGTDTVGGPLTGPGPLTVVLTNSGALRFNQGASAWGGSNAIFSAGSAGTINNHSTGSVSIVLGALLGGSGSSLQGSDQSGAGVDTYVVGNLNSNTTFAGTVANGSVHTVALTEIGSGTFALSGANTYSGGTTVSNGTLLVNNTTGSGTGAGAVTVVSAGIVGGGGVISGPTTVSGTLAPGNSPGTLTISNNLVVNGGAILRYELGTNSDLTVVSGNLTLGGTLNIIDAGGFTNATYTLFTYSGALTYNGVTIGTTPNPGFDYAINTNLAGQVRLIVTASGGVGAAGPITGPTSANAGDSGAGYSIASVSGATTYTWLVPSGATVASGQGTNSITVNFGCGAISGNVSVTPSNPGGSGGSSSLAVTVTNVGAAGSITGASAVCASQSGVTYFIASVSGATTYTWAVPSGATIASGQGTTSITVNWASTGGSVTVTPANANGCQGSASSLPITINTAPNITSGPLPQTTCAQGSAQFTLTATGAGLTYQWRKNGTPLSDGGTVSQSAGLPLVLTGVDTNDSGASFDCVVSGTCGSPATSGTAALTVNPLPALFNVTGGGAFCASNGVAVGLDGSQSSVNYQLQLNGNPTGSPIGGTGTAISFGTQTNAGNYTVVGIDATTGCTNTMNGSATATTDPFQCWQLQYFGCTNCPQAAASADPDGDAQNNLAEFLSGTDPTNSASALRVISAVRQGSDVLITWTTAGSHTNAVQSTIGDGNGGYATNFTDISGPIIITGSGDTTTNYTDTGGATNGPSQYYRVRLVP